MASEDDDSEGVIRRNRFSGDPAHRFMSSLATDERIFEADLAVDRTYVAVLASQDIIESEVASKILAALNEVEAVGHDALSGGEDVYEVIEAVVIDIVGPDGGKMHTARSRNDEVATCIHYRLREDVLSALDAALTLRESLLEATVTHTETVMPGYMHLQPAQPTTVAHFLLSYERAVAHDCARLMCAYERINQSPLGSTALASTPFDVNRELVADLLGFDRVMGNSMDASATRDFLAETLSAFTTHVVTLSGPAADLMIFSNRGLVELSDDYSSTSSIMPQKKNSDTMELVHAVAGGTVGELTGPLTTLEGLLRAYNRDLQRVYKHAFRTVDGVGEAAAIAAGAVASAAWPEDELTAAAGGGFSTATGVADLLAIAGLPFHTTHEVVAEAAARSEGTPGVVALDAVATDVLGKSLLTHVTAEVVETALDPTESMVSRDSVDEPAPTAAEATLSTIHGELSDDTAAVANACGLLTAVAEGLDEEASSYVWVRTRDARGPAPTTPDGRATTTGGAPTTPTGAAAMTTMTDAKDGSAGPTTSPVSGVE